MFMDPSGGLKILDSIFVQNNRVFYILLPTLPGPGPGSAVGCQVFPGSAGLPVLRAGHDPLQAPPRLHLQQNGARCGELILSGVQ